MWIFRFLSALLMAAVLLAAPTQAQVTPASEDPFKGFPVPEQDPGAALRAECLKHFDNKKYIATFKNEYFSVATEFTYTFTTKGDLTILSGRALCIVVFSAWDSGHNGRSNMVGYFDGKTLYRKTANETMFTVKVEPDGSLVIRSTFKLSYTNDKIYHYQTPLRPAK